MPELPEVETLKRQLAPRLSGCKVLALQIFDRRWCHPATPERLESAVGGSLIVGLERRGKYLIMKLNSAAAITGPSAGAISTPLFLIMHLRMTGKLLFLEPASDVRPALSDRGDFKHTRARFQLSATRAELGSLPSSGNSDRVAETKRERRRLLFVDPRRFGHALLIEGQDELDQYLDSRLGLEPLDNPDFTPGALEGMTQGRTAPIKAFLLDQRRIAGIGNIYADEALFRAKIHPRQPAGTLKPAEIQDLHAAILASLEAGIEAQGASIDDFRHYNGKAGRMQDEFLVHRRAGAPCPVCKEPVIKVRAASRGTYLCPYCQQLRRRKVRPQLAGA